MLKVISRGKLKQIIGELNQTDNGRSILWSLDYKDNYDLYENLSDLIFMLKSEPLRIV